MRRWTLSLVGFLAFPLVAGASVSKEDVRKLVENRISDELIIAFIRANGPVSALSSADLVELKKLGASDSVVLALLNAGPAPPVRRPVRERAREPEREVDRRPSPDTVCLDMVSEVCAPTISVQRTFPRIRIRTGRFGRFAWRGRCR